MELIKRIKRAESQAQEIIDQAKAGASKQAEEQQKNRSRLLAEAEQRRRKAIESAVAEAHSQGVAEVKKLKAQAEKDRQMLRDKVADRMDPAVTKVIDYLKS